MGGNLLAKKEYPYQTGTISSPESPDAEYDYVYGDSNWKDKLTEYNSHAITYDAIGNPLSYHNNWNFTWQKGRQLASATNGTDSISYGYNPEGYRTSKTVNGVTTRYTLEGSLVKFERTGSTSTWYYYDASGSPIGMCVGGSNLYLYRKNLQGDITGIYSGSTGTLLVSYDYDAWGKPTITDVVGTTESGNLVTRNPYLYRGYRYDHETGLYYLNSRYYDPETGRFVNADVYASTGDSSIACNMFAYCRNNPVSKIDGDGKRDYSVNLMISDSISSTVPRDCKYTQMTDYGYMWEYCESDPGFGDWRNYYTYATGITSVVACNPGDISEQFPTDKSNVYDVYISVREDLCSLGKSVRPLYGPTAKIFPNERKVALRVTLEKHLKKMAPSIMTITLWFRWEMGSGMSDLFL